MLDIDKMKRDSFLSAFDGDPIDLCFMVSNVRRNSKNVASMNEKEINLKALEYIKYLLENNLFEVCDDYSCFEKLNLSINDILLKTKELLESDDDLSFKYFFQLTPKGRKEADQYFNKLTIIREKVLLLCENNYLNIQTIISIVKEIFETSDPEEIEYEFIESIAYLTDCYFIEAGIISKNVFQGYGLLQSEGLRDRLKEFGAGKEINFRITKKGKIVLEEWRKYGGRIENYFDKIKFFENE